MSPSRLPNDAVCIYSHSSVETTKSASVRMQFGYVIPISANSCQCAKSVERRYTLVMHGVCEMSSSLHTITLSTRLSPTGHRGQLINLTCRVFHGNCEECISAFKHWIKFPWSTVLDLHRLFPEWTLKEGRQWPIGGFVLIDSCTKLSVLGPSAPIITFHIYLYRYIHM